MQDLWVRFAFRRVSLFCSLLLFAVTSACAPARPPVPVGTVPAPKAPTASEEEYGHKVLSTLTEKFELDYDHPRNDNVHDIVERLTTTIGAQNDPWHVHVFKDSKFKNAAATRGNHVFIWTAMIDATQNDEELAAILAHEIAHVLARHTDPDPNEEVRKMLIGLGALAAGIAVSRSGGTFGGQQGGRLAQQLAQKIGSGVLVNPYSQEREHEADQIGLFLMADSKYDPRSAVEFWTRATRDPSFGGGAGPISFLSTHPPATNRLGRLQKLLPRAIARFEGKELPPAPQIAGTGRPKPAASGSTSGGTGSSGSSSPRPNTPAPKSTGADDDSFDMRTAGGSVVKIPNSKAVAWILREPKAVLYSKPALSSRAIGEFRQGAVVRAHAEHGGWLEIHSPDHGFLPKKLFRRAKRR